MIVVYFFRFYKPSTPPLCSWYRHYEIPLFSAEKKVGRSQRSSPVCRFFRFSPEVTLPHCFRKCSKVVVAAPANAIHHVMDDDPFWFRQSWLCSSIKQKQTNNKKQSFRLYWNGNSSVLELTVRKSMPHLDSPATRLQVSVVTLHRGWEKHVAAQPPGKHQITTY